MNLPEFELFKSRILKDQGPDPFIEWYCRPGSEVGLYIQESTTGKLLNTLRQLEDYSNALLFGKNLGDLAVQVNGFFILPSSPSEETDNLEIYTTRHDYLTGSRLIPRQEKRIVGGFSLNHKLTLSEAALNLMRESYKFAKNNSNLYTLTGGNLEIVYNIRNNRWLAYKLMPLGHNPERVNIQMLWDIY